MKPDGKGYDEDAKYKKVDILDYRVLGLNSTKFTNGLGGMAIAFVNESTYHDQDSEDNWSSNATKSKKLECAVSVSTIL